MQITNPELEEYCKIHTTPFPKIFDHLKNETFATQSAPNMQIGFLEGSFLQLFVRLMNAKRILEIGTFTGYSALAMASAMPVDGKLITCDIHPVTTQLAKKYWEQSEHGKKITLKLGAALETLPHIDGPFDIAFIDADKENYINYWNECLPKIRPGGLIIVDNVLWGGRVLEPKEKADFHICAFNEMAKNDTRAIHIMLPIRDGIFLALKK